jgi:hypothetical protein
VRFGGADGEHCERLAGLIRITFAHCSGSELELPTDIGRRCMAATMPLPNDAALKIGKRIGDRSWLTRMIFHIQIKLLLQTEKYSLKKRPRSWKNS